MKINRIDLINGSNKIKAKTTKRLGAHLLDIFIVAILACILSIVIDLNLIPNLPSYISSYNEVVATQQETYKALKDTKLVKFSVNENSLLVLEDKNMSSPTKAFKDYALNHVNGTVDETNDPFTYYYLTYRKDNSFGLSEEYTQKYLNTSIYLLNENPKYNTSAIWEYSDINNMPTMSTKYKEALAKYFDGGVNQETQKYYNDLYDFYIRVYKNALNEFINSEKSIYPDLYLSYVASGEKAMSIRANSVLICTLTSLTIYYFFFTFLFRNGETVGKRVMHLACIDKNKEKISVLKVIFKNLIMIICGLFICSVPVVFLGNQLMFSYLFKIGAFEFKMFYVFLISMILSLVSLALMFFSKSTSSIDELLTRSEVIDIEE